MENWQSSFEKEVENVQVNIRDTMHDDGQRPITIGHLSDLGDLKISLFLRQLVCQYHDVPVNKRR